LVDFKFIVFLRGAAWSADFSMQFNLVKRIVLQFAYLSVLKSIF